MSAAPVARLRTPGEVAVTVPWLVGFEPTESLVVVALHEPRGRVGLTMRFDLPPAQHEVPLVDEVVARLHHEGATRALLVVYTAAPDARAELPREGLVHHLLDRLRGDDVDVREALLVRDGRWWSYACDRPCCPPAGTPLVASAESSAVALVAAESVLAGRGVLPSRDALAASIAVDVPAEELLGRCAAAADELAADVRGSAGEAGRSRWRMWCEVLDRFADPGAQLEPDEAARLAVSLVDRLLRDEVAVEALVRPEALLLLLAAVARRTPPPYDAPVCALLAWVAYGRGDGGLANVALERALASDPEHSLAVLLADALHRQVPPALLRDVLRATRDELRRRPA